MQKLVLFVLLALCVNANAFFVGGNIWDSRIQSDNVIREPAGALGSLPETNKSQYLADSSQGSSIPIGHSRAQP